MTTMAATLSAKLSSSNESTWMRLGALSELMHDTEKALYCYENAIRHSPYNVKALTQAASICRMREQYPKAVDYFLRILGVEDTNGEIWGAVGHCYLMMDDLQNAYTAYQKALYHLPNPKDPNLWYGIGILYDRYGSFDHAEEAFTAVLKMDNKFEKANEIYFRLGIIYKQQMKHEQSLDCFRYILQKPPRPLVQADIWFQIGHVYELQKDFQLAKDAYERVLKENPSHAKVLQQLGWLYHHNPTFGNQDTAISYLMRSIDSDPSDGQTWYLLGRCYMAQQKFRKAYDAYQQAVYRDGRNPTFWCSIGVLYYQINQYRDALDAYSRAIRLNPYLSEVWYDLGTLYESCNNQISDALDAYQRAAELDPHNKHIQQRLAMLRQQLPGGAGKAGPKDFPEADDDRDDKSVPRTMEPRHGPSDGMGLSSRVRRSHSGMPGGLEFPEGDKPMPAAKLPDIVDLSEERPSLPSAADLNSSLNEPKTAHKSALEAAPEESNKKLKTSNEKMEEAPLPLHKENSFTNGNGPSANATSNGISTSITKEDTHKEKEKEKEKEKDKDTKDKEKEKEKEKEKDKDKEKDKEKSAGTGSKKDDDYYDRESDNENEKPSNSTTKKPEETKETAPTRPTETIPEKEGNGRKSPKAQESDTASAESAASKRGLDDVSQTTSKRAKRSPSQDKSPNNSPTLPSTSSSASSSSNSSSSTSSSSAPSTSSSSAPSTSSTSTNSYTSANGSTSAGTTSPTPSATSTSPTNKKEVAEPEGEAEAEEK